MEMKNFFKTILKNNHTNKSGSFNPEKDWKIIFLLAVAFFIVSIIFNGYIFWSVKEGKIFNSQVKIGERIPAILNDRLNKSIEFFEVKKARFEDLRKNRPQTFDPMQ